MMTEMRSFLLFSCAYLCLQYELKAVHAIAENCNDIMIASKVVIGNVTVHTMVMGTHMRDNDLQV